MTSIHAIDSLEFRDTYDIGYTQDVSSGYSCYKRD